MPRTDRELLHLTADNLERWTMYGDAAPPDWCQDAATRIRTHLETVPPTPDPVAQPAHEVVGTQATIAELARRPGFREGLNEGMRARITWQPERGESLETQALAANYAGRSCHYCRRPALWNGETCVKCTIHGPQPAILPF